MKVIQTPIFSYQFYREVAKPLALARETGISLHDHLTEMLRGAFLSVPERTAINKIRGQVQATLTLSRKLERTVKREYDWNYGSNNSKYGPLRKPIASPEVLILNDALDSALYQLETVFSEYRTLLRHSVATRSLVYTYFSRSLHAYSTLKSQVK